jgi:redox-sensitive bicupin YhaK (pirin superfamily)
MPDIRKIRKILKSRPTLEGAGVHLKRAFGWHHVPELDPFLLLDDFHSSRPEEYLPGFPWHPHRGIETITYVLEGKVEHGDSMGNTGVIGPGDVQWMTAGSGIVHQEMPKGRADGRMWGFQLWANLPASHKMMEPRYRGIVAGEIPVARLAGGATAKVICGEAEGVRGPVRDIVTEPEYLDVALPPETSLRRRVRPGHTAFAYVIDGSGIFGPDSDPFDIQVEGRSWFDMKRELAISPESLVMFDDGDEISVCAGPAGARFLLVSGKPIGEPVAWWGPIVMNTQEELRVAFDEYERGTFLKHSKR